MEYDQEQQSGDTTLQQVASIDTPPAPQRHHMITRHKATEIHLSLVSNTKEEILRKPENQNPPMKL